MTLHDYNRLCCGGCTREAGVEEQSSVLPDFATWIRLDSEAVKMNNCTGHNGVVTAIATATIGGAGIVVSSFVIYLVLRLRLHKRFTYRLALYQVISSLLLTAIIIVALAFVNYKPGNTYRVFCVIMAFLRLYTEWNKVLLTAWVGLHLFCFSTRYKNLKRFEIAYVATSLFIPLVVAIIPLATRTYGYTTDTCWITEWKTDCSYSEPGNIEQNVLWYAPALVILLVDTTGVGVIFVTLLRRAYVEDKKNTSALGEKNKHALRHMLPFMAYPFILLSIVAPQAVLRWLERRHPKHYTWFGPLFNSSYAALSLATGSVLLIHILCFLRCNKRKLLPYKLLQAKRQTLYI